MPVVAPEDSTRAQPIIEPLAEPLAEPISGPISGPISEPISGDLFAEPSRSAAEPPTDLMPMVPPPPAAPAPAPPVPAPSGRAPSPSAGPGRRAPEPPTEAVPVVRQEPPTAAVKTIPPDLFTQHLPPAEPPENKDGKKDGEKKRRLAVDIGPGALRRTWAASDPPKPMRRAFLAAFLAPAVHVLTIVLGLVFVAIAYGAYSLGTVLVGNVVGIVGWVVAALVAVWVGVQARAGRLWAAIVLAVLAVAALAVTVDLALSTLTWIGLSGLPGLVRLVLLVVAGLLAVAVPVLMIGPFRSGYFRSRSTDH
jgi:hypothetical protein